jgi:hypothetical protein
LTKVSKRIYRFIVFDDSFGLLVNSPNSRIKNDASGLRAPKTTSWGLEKLCSTLKQSALRKRQSSSRQKDCPDHEEDALDWENDGLEAKKIFPARKQLSQVQKQSALFL